MTRGMSVFGPALFRLLRYGNISDPGMGPSSRRERRDLDVGPRGNSPHVDSMSPSPSTTSQQSWCFHTGRGGIDPGMSVFGPALFRLLRYGNISDPGMGPSSRLERRDLDVGPRGNSRRTLIPPAPANRQSASKAGASTPGGAVSTGGTSVYDPRC